MDFLHGVILALLFLGLVSSAVSLFLLWQSSRRALGGNELAENVAEDLNKVVQTIRVFMEQGAEVESASRPEIGLAKRNLWLRARPILEKQKSRSKGVSSGS